MVTAFVQEFSRWQKSEFQIVKIHAMSHYSQAIRRSGSPFEYSSNMYEHLHIALMKTAYRASNKKDYHSFIVKHNRRLQALRKSALGKEGFEHPEKGGSTLDEVRMKIHERVYFLWEEVLKRIQ